MPTNLLNLKKGYSQLDDLSGVTVTASEINTLSGGVADVDFTVGADAGGTVTINMQFNDATGTACTARQTIYFYLSDDANGDSLAGTAPDGGIAGGTDGFIDVITTGKSFYGSSEVDGDLDIVITESGADTWYLVAVLPSGGHVVSDVITFTA